MESLEIAAAAVLARYLGFECAVPVPRAGGFSGAWVWRVGAATDHGLFHGG